MAKRYNICVCKVYQSQGQEKKAWPNVGSMVYFPATEGKDERYILELNMFPLTKFYVFDQKPKVPTTPQRAPDDPMN